MTTSGYIRLLLESYADREKATTVNPNPPEAYAEGVRDGITILAQELLEYFKETS